MATFEGVEIPDEFLESISGGQLTPEARDAVIRYAERMKKLDLPEDYAIELTLCFGRVDVDERIALIREVYASE